MHTLKRVAHVFSFKMVSPVSMYFSFISVSPIAEPLDPVTDYFTGVMEYCEECITNQIMDAPGLRSQLKK